MNLVRHLVSKSRNLTAVVDLDQSIYAFRAADPRHAEFSEEFNANVVVQRRLPLHGDRRCFKCDRRSEPATAQTRLPPVGR